MWRQLFLHGQKKYFTLNVYFISSHLVMKKAPDLCVHTTTMHMAHLKPKSSETRPRKKYK